MTYQQLIQHLQNGVFAPVYLLCGTESYYIDLASDWIENNVLDEMAKAFDQTVLYGKDLRGEDIAQAVDLARGMAMMGGKRVVLVKEAQTVRKWDALALYLKNPQPNTLFVLCYKYGTPDKRLALWKDFEKQGGIIMLSDKMKDYQVEGWVSDYLNTRARADGHDLNISPKVPGLLAAYIGNDLTTIIGAVDKLIAGLPEGQNTIDEQLVERNIGISKDYNVFELQDAIIKGDILRANRIVRYFAGSKDHPMIKEMGILYTFFANLLIYLYLPDKNERVAAPILGVPPFYIKDYKLAAERFTKGKVFRIIGYFRDTDARLKGINNPSAKDEDLWKELIYKILH